ncbi:MAG: hypothetical protein WC700_10430 [Gemmatimonadaceae bacterium]
MSEPATTTTETPAAEVSALTFEERIDAAARGAVPEEPEAPEEPGEEEPAGEETPPTDEEPTPKRGSLAWRHAQVRRREQALEARDAELGRIKGEMDSLMGQIKARDEQTRAVAQLVELARQDPDRAFAMLAERAGMSDAQLYERVTRQRLRDPAQREEPPELAEMRAEIRAIREEQRQRLEQEQQQTTSKALEDDVAKVVALADYPDRWPYASEWPAERLKTEARRYVQQAHHENRQVTARDLADKLERMASYEEETRRKVREARAKSPDPQKGGDGRGLPGAAREAPKPAGTRRAAISIGNADNASTAARKVGTSFDERFALAVAEAAASTEK